MQSLRWKLIVMTVAIVFIPVFLLNRYAITFFDSFTRTELENNMRHYAFIAGEQYKLFLGEPVSVVRQQKLSQLFERMGRELDAQVRIIGRDGTVRFDSGGADEGDVYPFSDRPEITAALTGGYSAKSRLTPNRRLMYFYVARPIKDEQKNVLGVAYVVTHTNSIVQAIRRMIINQRLATYIAIGCAILVATVLALTMTRRLRALMREARAFAAGRMPLGVAPRGGDEIAELGRAIHRMADEIEARNTYNREFIQTTLHELKTPLTAIRGATEVLEGLEEQDTNHGDDADAAKPGRRFLGIIGFQVGRLMQLVGDLRELTRVDVELSRTPREERDYCAFVREAIDRLAVTFSEPHAELVVEVPDEPIVLSFVAGRLEQVFANLLENAFRYTPTTGTVRVVVEQGEAVKTTVSDSGCGIAPSNVERVFDRFFTTERNQKPQDYGSGLGLAIVASIVRSHSGNVWATSELGQGAQFAFTLPRES